MELLVSCAEKSHANEQQQEKEDKDAAAQALATEEHLAARGEY